MPCWRGDSFFRQVDRGESLIHLLRVNILKRVEGSVASRACTHRETTAKLIDIPRRRLSLGALM